MTSAAGKYLIKMDLPLARRKPSPPNRLREVLRLARRCPIALPKPYADRPLLAEATRAGFEFVGRTHRREFTLNMSAIHRLQRYREPVEAIELPFHHCKCSDKPGAFQCQEKNGLASDLFGFFGGLAISWRRRAYLEVLGRDGGTPRRRERDNSSK
jgi:hypothetical protein